MSSSWPVRPSPARTTAGDLISYHAVLTAPLLKTSDQRVAVVVVGPKYRVDTVCLMSAGLSDAFVVEVAIEIERNRRDFDILAKRHRVRPTKKTKIIIGKPPDLPCR